MSFIVGHRNFPAPIPASEGHVVVQGHVSDLTQAMEPRAVATGTYAKHGSCSATRNSAFHRAFFWILFRGASYFVDRFAEPKMRTIHEITRTDTNFV